MIEIVVHDHALKHDLSEEEIIYAWTHFVVKQHREVPHQDEVLAVGFDRRERAIQMVGYDMGYQVLVFHALTPPTEKVLRELGLARR